MNKQILIDTLEFIAQMIWASPEDEVITNAYRDLINFWTVTCSEVA